MSDEVHHSTDLANRLDPRVHENNDIDKTGDGLNSSGHQDSSQLGEDPNLVTDNKRKLTGTGAPGSHSALFGLTPDGTKSDKVDYDGPGNIKPAHSKESSNAASGEGSSLPGKASHPAPGTGPSLTGDSNPSTSGEGNVDGGVGNRAGGGQELKNQMNDPSLSHGSTEGDGSGKPGAGGSLIASPTDKDTTGTGGIPTDSSTASSGGIFNTIKSYVTGSTTDDTSTAKTT